MGFEIGDYAEQNNSEEDKYMMILTHIKYKET